MMRQTTINKRAKLGGTVKMDKCNGNNRRTKRRDPDGREKITFGQRPREIGSSLFRGC